jgi:NAD(P)-dependent dehydrogenase (short-subunit alcohol dehydrogenase family)
MDTNYFERHLLKRFTVLFSAAAINHLTKSLACEWAKDNIRSNCVAPWYTKTPLVEHVMLFHTYNYPFCSEAFKLFLYR